MAWNQPDDDQPRAPLRAGLPGRRRLAPPPALRSVGALALMALLAWLGSGLHEVEPGERAQVLRLGREVALLEPGVSWRLPWPFETVRYVDVDTVRSLSFDSRMRAAVAGPFDLGLTVRYRVSDARTYLSGVDDPDETLRRVAEGTTRATVATLAVEDLFDAERRRALLEPVLALTQARLDALHCGLAVEDIEVARVDAPVVAASGARALAEVIAQRQTLTQQLREYESQLLPPARQQTTAALQDARSYRAQSIAAAETDAARFEALLPAYQQSPQLLRQRLYVEAVEDILTRARKVVIDNRAGAGAPIYLPLDQLLKGLPTPVASAVPAPTAAAPAPAPGKAAAAPATAAPPAVDERALEEERSRDRTER